MTKARILIVEDESIVAMSIKQKLEKMEYEVVDMVSSGRAAIKATEKYDPDLILMDIVIKGNIDGIDTAKAIHKNKDIPVIYLTAYADEEILSRARVTQPYGYIVKPFKSNELNANIEMAIYKHQNAQVENQHFKELAVNNFNKFLNEALPTDSSQSEKEIKSMLANIFGDSLEESHKQSYLNKMNELGIDANFDPVKILEAYVEWVSNIFLDMGIRNIAKTTEDSIDLEFDNCPWKDEAIKNPMFCINCYATINRSLEWTNLESDVQRAKTIAGGSDYCLFKLLF